MSDHNGEPSRGWDAVRVEIRAGLTDAIAADGFVQSAEDVETFLDYLSRVICMVYRRAEDMGRVAGIEVNIKRKHYLESSVRVIMTVMHFPSEQTTPIDDWFLRAVFHTHEPAGDIVLQLPRNATAFFSERTWERLTSLPITDAMIRNVSDGRAGIPTTCRVCKKTGKMLVCSRCEREYYCSRECQREDWKQHKKVCMAPGSLVPLDTIGIEYRSRDGRVLERVGPASPGMRLMSIERNCYGNCVMNMARLNLTGARLHLVAGSLGLCDPTPTWYEWGGSDGEVHTTVEQFKKCAVTGKPSVHFWMEDDADKVWDILDYYLVHTVIPAHEKKVDTNGFLMDRLIAGESRDQLQARGLLYVSAAPEIQKQLIGEASFELRILP